MMTDAEWFADAVSSASETRDRAQKGLKDRGIDDRIDEVSLLFPNMERLLAFVAWASSDTASGGGGMTHFNSVRDSLARVDTDIKEGLPPEAFGVAFEFLAVPNEEDPEADSAWRIEAMCVTDGVAPIHKQALEDFGEACIVHASFKCQNQWQYEFHRDRLNAKKEMRAEYTNEYGRFAYFPYGDYYLKPRVNLRDQ